LSVSTITSETDETTSITSVHGKFDYNVYLLIIKVTFDFSVDLTTTQSSLFI
jgi:hypothetical protein